jgi:hypothetical protein
LKISFGEVKDGRILDANTLAPALDDGGAGSRSWMTSTRSRSCFTSKGLLPVSISYQRDAPRSQIAPAASGSFFYFF